MKTIKEKKMIVVERRNEFIAEYLDAYLAMKKIDFAVMISGPWGCGKTYFIKNYISRRRQKLADDRQNLFWYVSLHGITNTAEIDLRLFEAAHPIMGAKNIRLIGHLARGLVESGVNIRYGVDADSTKKIFDASQQLYNKLVKSYCGKNRPVMIVFDDIERCKLDKTVLLGYLGDLLQEEIPLVILGAESEIEAEERKKKMGVVYSRIREKVVGKTFWLQDELLDVFRVLVGDGIYENAQLRLKDQYKVIVDDLRKGREDNWQCNYRALKHVFRLLDYILGGLKIHKTVWQNESFLNDFVRVFVVLGYEVQVGALEENDFLIDDACLLSKEERKKYKLLTFLDAHNYSLQYNNMEQLSLLLPIHDLRSIFFSRKADRKKIGQGIANLPMFSVAVPDEWYLFWNWFKLDDQEACRVYSKIQDGLMSYKYCKAGEIVHIFSILCTLTSRKYIKNSVSKLKREFVKYVSRLNHDGRLLVEDQWQYMADEGWGGCAYWKIDGDKNPSCRYFFDYISTLMIQRDKTRKECEQKHLFYECSKHPDDVRVELMKGMPDSRPLLKDISAQKFFTEFLKLNTEGRVKIRYAFRHRFVQYPNARVFTDEKKFVVGLLKEVKIWMRSNRKSSFGRPSFMVMEDIKEILESAISRANTNHFSDAG